MMTTASLPPKKNSLVYICGAGQTQIGSVLFKDIRRAVQNSPFWNAGLLFARAPRGGNHLSSLTRAPKNASASARIAFKVASASASDMPINLRKLQLVMVVLRDPLVGNGAANDQRKFLALAVGDPVRLELKRMGFTHQLLPLRLGTGEFIENPLQFLLPLGTIKSRRAFLCRCHRRRLAALLLDTCCFGLLVIKTPRGANPLPRFLTAVRVRCVGQQTLQCIEETHG